MIPRVSGSNNISLVGDYIHQHFQKLKWSTEIDEFEDKTPLGVKKFKNFIFTHNPQAPFRLSISAHYDSKYFPEPNKFVGATDSAASCALMMDLASFFTPLLDKVMDLRQGLKGGNVPLPPYIGATGGDQANFTTTFGPGYDGRQLSTHDVSLQFIFFDGEEAFENWSDFDSTYGSRHLADVWSRSYIDTSNSHHQQISKRRFKPTPTELDRIDHLVLLDLIGSKNPSIRSYFPETDWLFNELMDAENKINDIVANDPQLPDFNSRFFRKGVSSASVEDDHLPFLHKGVPILHIIPTPFPTVWHKISDDASALDLPTLGRWNAIFRLWIAEYLHLKPLIH